MKRSLRYLSFLLAVLLFLPLQSYGSVPEASTSLPQPQATTPYLSTTINGKSEAAANTLLSAVFLESMDNKNYPQSPNDSVTDMEQQATAIIQKVVDSGLNSVFYDVSPLADSMYQSNYLPTSRFASASEGGRLVADPLKILKAVAKRNNIAVCVVINPFYIGRVDDKASLSSNNPAIINPNNVITLNNKLYLNPAKEDVQHLIANTAYELVSQYGVEGVLFDISKDSDFVHDISYYQNIQNSLQECARTIWKENNGIKFGVALDAARIDDILTLNFSKTIAENHVIDFIIPMMNLSTEKDNRYQTILESWQSVVAGTSTLVFTGNYANKLMSPSTDGVFFGDEKEINYQLFLNRSLGINGALLHSYNDLVLSCTPLSEDITSLSSITSRLLNQTNLPLPSGFSITNPPINITTASDNYFISGICDPAVPLMMNDEVIPVTDWGGFGIYVPLDEGENAFLLSQNDVVKSTVITKKKLDDSPKKITTIQEASTFPFYDEAIPIDQPIVLKCIAPSNGVVSARFSDFNFDLQQTNPDIEDGFPAEFTYTLDNTLIPVDDYVNLGPITYSLTYNGRTTVQSSEGTLSIVSARDKLALRIRDNLASIYQDPTTNQIINIQQKDTLDYATESTDDFYRLQSGGYIRKDAVEVIKEDLLIEKEIKNVIIQPVAKGEYITFAGGEGLPYYLNYDESARILYFTIYNVTGVPSTLSYLESDLFSQIAVTNTGHNALIALSLKDGKNLYGADVSFSDGNMILYCKSNFIEEDASISMDNPFEGITVVLDPGHGGPNSTGNLGITGELGANESDINLAVCKLLQNRFEALGATVVLTRSDDTPISTMDRVMLAKYKEADIFLSIHQSFVPEEDDGNAKSGVSIAYNHSFAKEFAQRMEKELSARLDRKIDGVIEKNDFIRQISNAPALQINLGYMTNPSEYARLCNQLEMYRSSCIITDVVLDLVKSTGQVLPAEESVLEEESPIDALS